MLQLNSSRYCSLRITKANAIIRRMWEKREGHFWSLHYLLEETGLSMWFWVPGILPGAAHTFKDTTDLMSSLQPLDSAKWEPYWWGGLLS